MAVELLEVADSLAYARRFDEQGKSRRTGVEYLAKVAAGQLVRQLTASGFIIMAEGQYVGWSGRLVINRAKVPTVS